MYKFLPSKRFNIIFLLLITILIIIYYFSFYKNNKTVYIISPDVGNKTKITESKTLDSDLDGLPDWEEILWKTDPKNPDTDSDGTSDSAEIMASRSPIKPNTSPTNQEPNDKNIEPVTAIKESAEDLAKLTITEKMSRELYLQYINTRKISSALTTSDMENIVSKTMSHLPEISFKVYSNKDILVSAPSDKITLQKYANDVAEIILTNLKTRTKDVDSIINAISNITDDTKLEEQTKEIFKRFDPLISKNLKTVSDLQKINVPEVFVVEHLKLLNSFQELYESLDIMQKSAGDLMVLVIFKSHYYTSAENLATALVEITKKVFSLGISFSNPNDYGYQFFDAIMLKN